METDRGWGATHRAWHRIYAQKKEKGTVKDNIQHEGPGLDTQPIKRNHKKGKDTYRKEKGHRIKKQEERCISGVKTPGQLYTLLYFK